MRVLLADDQQEVRSALRLLLEDEPDLCVVGEAAEAKDLIGCLEETCPDVVLLDWELPGLDANGYLAYLRAGSPRPHVIVLSGKPEAHRASLAAGADAFVSKGDPPEHLLETVRIVCASHPPDAP